MKQVLDSQRAWVERVVFYELMNVAGLQAGLRALLPRQAEAVIALDHRIAGAALTAAPAFSSS